MNLCDGERYAKQSARLCPTRTLTSRALFTYLNSGGGQVDGDPAQRPGQPTGEQGRPHPVARLAHSGVRQAHDGEAGQAGGTWTSTETDWPTAPVRVAAAIQASMPKNGRPLGARYPDVSGTAFSNGGEWLRDLVEARRDQSVGELTEEWLSLDSAIWPFSTGPAACSSVTWPCTNTTCAAPSRRLTTARSRSK